MTWWKASSVTVTAGQSTVTVNTGDDIGMIKGAEGLVIGNQPPVEIKRSYLNASVMILELVAPWPYANQSGQPAIAFPTDGDLAAATAVLKQLINGFAIATELEMQQATNNVNPASALGVKKSIDFHRPLQNSPNDTDQSKIMGVGAFGLGAMSILVNPDTFSGGGFISDINISNNNDFNFNSIINLPYHTATYGAQIGFQQGQPLTIISARVKFEGAWQPSVRLCHSGNTTVDSNGFIKSASPIVKLFNDRIIKNGSFLAEFERISVGSYQIKDSPGFAEEGWYIETPKDANGNIKVFVEYEQLADKTIVIKTYEPDYSNGKAAAGEPCDIPPNRWIDIRLKEPAQVSAISLEQ